MYHTDPTIVQELQAQIEAIVEEIMGDMLRDKVDNFVVRLQRVHKVETLILRMCSREDHMHTSVHEGGLSFTYHTFLYSRKLRIYST
jgi:hypothetical protein